MTVLKSTKALAAEEFENENAYLCIENAILQEKLDLAESMACHHFDQTLDAAMIACAIMSMLQDYTTGVTSGASMVNAVQGACAELVARMKEKA